MPYWNILYPFIKRIGGSFHRQNLDLVKSLVHFRFMPGALLMHFCCIFDADYFHSTLPQATFDLTQPNPKGLKVQFFSLQLMGYPSPEEATPQPWTSLPHFKPIKKIRNWLLAGQVTELCQGLHPPNFTSGLLPGNFASDCLHICFEKLF